MVALEKSITDERGVTASYFRVVSVIEEYESDQSQVTVHMRGYTSKEVRSKEKRDREKGTQVDLSVAHKAVLLPVDDAKGYTRSDIYTRVKLEAAEFQDAKDILDEEREDVK